MRRLIDRAGWPAVVGRVRRWAAGALCGGALAISPAAATTEPPRCSFLDGHNASDQSLAYMAEQPAGPVSCGYAQVAVKCGEHALARRIFDKCIAKGYAGAMIWKGLMLEDGLGGERDEAAAAALYRRAGESGEGHYAALGKLHYASALHQGKGVARDEAEARRWFERAAAEGSEDAAEFLRTGYHTGSRDALGRGVGVPTEVVQGQTLIRQSDPVPQHAPWQYRLALLVALLVCMVAGAWRQARSANPVLAAVRPAG